MSEVSADKLTKAYIKIRAKRAELSKQFKAEDDMLVEQLEKIKNALLNYCVNQNVEVLFLYKIYFGQLYSVLKSTDHVLL